MTLEWLQFTLGCLVFLGGCFGVALRIGYIVANTVNKITLETDAKIGRVYQRFDDYKTNMEANFVRRDMCQVIHNGSALTLINIEKKQDIQGEKLDALILKVAGLH